MEHSLISGLSAPVASAGMRKCRAGASSASEPAYMMTGPACMNVGCGVGSGSGGGGGGGSGGGGGCGRAGDDNEADSRLIAARTQTIANKNKTKPQTMEITKKFVISSRFTAKQR